MQQQKMNMSKKQFRIGDLAEELKVKKFVIRFWEKEFGIESDRSEGGQRFYTSDDLRRFLLIKDLLYNQGFTIAGAKKQLNSIVDQNLVKNEHENVVVAQQDAAHVEQTSQEYAAAVMEQVAPHSTDTPSAEEQEITPAKKVLRYNDIIVQQCNELKKRLINLKTKLEQ